MNKFKELIEENSIKEENIILEQEMTPEEFKSSVESSFKKHFPNGYIDVDLNANILSDKQYIRGLIGMIGNPKDNTNSIIQNDKMRHTFSMWALNDTEWSFEGNGKIYITPAEGSYNAMDSIKTGLGNNSKINLAKAEIKLAKFFRKLSDLMKENKDKIYGAESIDKKYMNFR